jgi:guanylate kinase
LSPDEFRARRERGEFLECFEVFGRGHWYGTLRETVTSSLLQGKWVVLEIDVQGMQAIVAQFPDAISIFVRPASLEELERRLRGRGTESEETIQRRLEVARREWQFKDQYRFDLVNQQVDETAQEMCRVLQKSPGETNRCSMN